jgi:hypothetical protein
MLANILAFLVQRSLTKNRLYPTLYESQVERREDSPLHRGVFVRRALDLLDTGGVDPSEVRLPRLVNLLRFGVTIPISDSDNMLVAINVESGSKLDGRTVVEIFGALEGITAVAVLRGPELLTPRGDTRFQANDQLLAVTAPAAHAAIAGLARAPHREGSSTTLQEEI